MTIVIIGPVRIKGPPAPWEQRRERSVVGYSSRGQSSVSLEGGYGRSGR